MTVVTALGDSFTCGEGVGVRVDPDATWVALLAGAFPDGRLVRLAEPGARVADVRDRQLPLVPGRVDVATVLVGLNDVGRSGFDAGRAAADLLTLVAALRERAGTVVVGRLHDAVSLLPLPARIAAACRLRLAAVNGAVDRAAALDGVHVVDLGAVPVLADPGGWSVDRIHPSPAGHRGMAMAAAEALRGAGLPVGPIGEGETPRGASRRARAWWAARHGVPYAATHLGDIGRPLASAMLRRG
ncbi:GDSL-type esterase/lipase family protein [Blastococcus sp. SYSU DS0753]